MQHYQPPHLRRQAAEQEEVKRAAAARHASAWSSTAAAGPSTRPQQSNYMPRTGPIANARSTYAPQASRRDWSTPARAAGNVLASPASDLKPMRRTPVNDIDKMDLIQSVSRSGGDGAEGDTLKDWAMQDKYRRYIDEKLDKHYTTFKRPRHTPPLVTEEDELHGLGSIVLLFRKLREGVVASDRLDMFAVEVFESSARLAILARNTAQLISAVSGLVPGLYLMLDAKGKGRADPRDSDNLCESVGRLKVSDPRREFASILLLFQLAHVGSRQAYHATLVELTQPTALRLRRNRLDGVTYVLQHRRPFIEARELSYATRAARSLAEETFDPVTYFRLISDSKMGTGYERAVLSWAESSVRDRAWRVLSKAYMSCDRVWAGRWCGQEGVAVDEWIKDRGGRVEGAILRLR